MPDHYALLSLCTLIFMFTCIFIGFYLIDKENRKLRKQLRECEEICISYMQENDLLHEQNRKLRFQLFFLQGGVNGKYGKTSPVKTSIIPLRK